MKRFLGNHVLIVYDGCAYSEQLPLHQRQHDNKTDPGTHYTSTSTKMGTQVRH